MSVSITSPQFKGNARAALKDPQLQRALGKVEAGFIGKRMTMTSIADNSTAPVGRALFTDTTFVLARFGTNRKDRSFES
jgi:hypothetical protein